MFRFETIRLNSFSKNRESEFGKRIPIRSFLHLKYQFQYFLERNAIIDIFQVKAFYNSELVLTEYVSVMKGDEGAIIDQFGYALQRPYLKEGLSAKIHKQR